MKKVCLISFYLEPEILEKKIVNVLLSQGQGLDEMEPVSPKLLSYTQSGEGSKG